MNNIIFIPKNRFISILFKWMQTVHIYNQSQRKLKENLYIANKENLNHGRK